MRPLQKKFAKYIEPQQAMKAGFYPFYHPIESGQDTEVILRGKKVLMFGSYSYLGLTNHASIIEGCWLAYAKTYKYNAAVMVDDAHSLGVLGNHGAGTATNMESTI